MTPEQQARAAFIARPSAKGMSEEQKAYCCAKAAHQLANEAARAEMAAVPEPPDHADEAAVNAYCERYAEADKRAGTGEASRLLHEAEEVLIAWGREVISRHKDSAKLPADFWERAAQSVNIRRQLIDLTMRLDAASWQRVTADKENTRPMITITIKTDNAAFGNDDGDGKAEGPEVARILRHLADKVAEESDKMVAGEVNHDPDCPVCKAVDAYRKARAALAKAGL